MDLRYGVNPDQKAYVTSATDGELPFRVLAGKPSYINILDALNAWRLVRELSRALGRPAATSFKHVSPAGAAVAGAIDEVMAETWEVHDSVGPLASAYLRARDADPKSSWGDFVAVSGPVDREFAQILQRTANDGIIAPGYEEGTVAVLSRKKRGKMLVLEIDPTVNPGGWERRDVFGVSLFQEVSQGLIDPSLFGSSALPESGWLDAVLGMLVVRFTQSNSVGLARDGMMIGVGAGQQSRVDCTRIAGAKADVWWLRRHPTARSLRFRDGVERQDRINVVIRSLEGDLTDAERGLFGESLAGEPLEISVEERESWLSKLDLVTFVSDGLVPFRDNVDQAAQHGVRFFVEPGGSIRSGEVTKACEQYGITHVETGMRLFHH